MQHTGGKKLAHLFARRVENCRRNVTDSCSPTVAHIFHLCSRVQLPLTHLPRRANLTKARFLCQWICDWQFSKLNLEAGLLREVKKRPMSVRHGPFVEVFFLITLRR